MPRPEVNFHDNAAFTHIGVTSLFFKKGGRFFVHTDGPDGRLADFEFKYTFGVEPPQRHLIEFPGGRLQTRIADEDKKRHTRAEG